MPFSYCWGALPPQHPRDGIRQDKKELGVLDGCRLDGGGCKAKVECLSVTVGGSAPNTPGTASAKTKKRLASFTVEVEPRLAQVDQKSLFSRTVR